MARGNEQTSVDLDPGECALVVGEGGHGITVRVAAAADVQTDGSDLPAAPELVLALAKRLMKDPDFHDDMLDWYYEHEDGADDDDDEEEDENES